MKLELNRPKGHNRYCGPAVVSILTGMTTNEAAAEIRNRSGQRAVRGTPLIYLLEVLRLQGWTTAQKRHFGRAERPTLAAWLRESRPRRKPGRVFLVVAGNHYQLVTGRRYICGQVGELVSIRDKRVKRRARVSYVAELQPRVTS